MQAMQSCGTLAAAIRGTCPAYFDTTVARRDHGTACTTSVKGRSLNLGDRPTYTSLVLDLGLQGRRHTCTNRTIRTSRSPHCRDVLGTSHPLPEHTTLRRPDGPRHNPGRR